MNKILNGFSVRARGIQIAYFTHPMRVVRHLVLCLMTLSAFSESPTAQNPRLIVKVETPLGPGGPMPLAGASVRVTAVDNRVVASGTTDSSGLVILAIPNVELRITASAAGYFIEGHAEVLSVAGDAFFTLTMLPLPDADLLPRSESPPPLPKGMISGRVTNVDGAPVSNATVRLSHIHATTATKDDGSFQLVVPLRPFDPPTFRLHVSPRAMPWRKDQQDVTYEPEVTEVPFAVSVQPGYETANVEIRVRTRPRFRVTVALRDERGSVLPGATVTVSGRPQGQCCHETGTFITDDDGIVTFTRLQGPITIDSMTNEASPRLAATVEANVEDKALDIVLSLRDGARLTGRVVFRGFERPLQEHQPLQVTSHVPGVEPGGWSSADLNGRVEADGAFVLDGLVGQRCLLLRGVPNGWVVERIRYDDYDITDVPGSFEAGQTAHIVITVARASDGQRYYHRPTCGAK